MEIIFHAHHAVISETMRLRAERTVRKIAKRLAHAVDAVIRFEQDGPTRRVEIVLHAPRQRDLVAEGRSRYYGPALKEAATKLLSQTARVKRTPKSRGREVARA